MDNGSSRAIFVNFAVEDLGRSVDFFTQLGFSFDPRFTDANGTCMIVNDEAYVMLLGKTQFKNFINKELADSTRETEAIVSFSAGSREQVDEITEKALAAGGSPANEPMDMGYMYGRSFQDPDGHLWEVFYMDIGAMQKEAREKEEAMSS
ncbi:MAG: VOC family protein [Gaiellaceae bacterium]